MSELKEKLVDLYQQMYDMTQPECAKSCRCPQTCCSPEYCEMALQYAQEEWGVDLTDKKTDHAKLPFMGPTGCVVPPHLRPICTMHTCDINGLGFKRGDMDWTERYFDLRERIEEADCLLSEQK